MKYQQSDTLKKTIFCLLLLFLGLMSASVTYAAETYSYVDTLGSYGTAAGQFNAAQWVAVDSSGNIYVSDTFNNRVQKFDGNGNFISFIGDQQSASTCSHGSGNGQFYYPEDIAIDSSGNIYVADHDNNRVQKFDSNGNYLTQFGSYGTGEGYFINPCGIDVDRWDNVYVSEPHNNRIQKFDSNGNFISFVGDKQYAASCSIGIGDGQFKHPCDVAVDSLGNIYVSDSFNNRIQKFDSKGNFITKWDALGNGASISSWSDVVAGEQYNVTTGIAVDSLGNVYVVDLNSYPIQKFDSKGNFITTWSAIGSGKDQLLEPFGVAVDSSGKVYVADYDNNRIQIFAEQSIQGIQQMTSSIKSLVTSGILNSEQGNSLTVKLDNAITDINAGKTKNAVNKLNAFINEVNADIQSGKLKQAQGQPLVDEANVIINAISKEFI